MAFLRAFVGSSMKYMQNPLFQQVRLGTMTSTSYAVYVKLHSISTAVNPRDMMRKRISPASSTSYATRLFSSEESLSSKSKAFQASPFNRRFAFSKKPFFPIEARNLRLLGQKKKKTRGRGDKSGAKGIRRKHSLPVTGIPNNRELAGNLRTPQLRSPRFSKSERDLENTKYEFLNLSKLRYFIEKGRLDTRFLITQRHLHDSRCCRVKNGVRLYNVNYYPFPYKIDIEVANADQSSIDVIKAVGGTIRIAYMDKSSLESHVKPYKFEVLRKSPRPRFEDVLFLEKMRARGCVVSYIKPLWLIQEEERVKSELAEIDAARNICAGQAETKDFLSTELAERYRESLLQRYRLRETSHGAKTDGEEI